MFYPRRFALVSRFMQPIGVGFSYGTHVNNSRAAAYDAYDFLIKFFSLHPHLARYGFVYMLLALR